MSPTAKKYLSRWFLGSGAALPLPQTQVPLDEKIDLAESADEDLMLAYRRGHEPAFATLLGRHQKPLYNYLLRSLKKPELAEEALQEVFLKVAKTRHHYEVTAKFTTWLYTMARHHCIDLARKGRFRQYVSLDQGLEDEKTRPAFERVLASEERVDLSSSAQELKINLEKILHEISPDQREVFLLREYQGLPFDEIARVMETSVNTVKSRMRYALQAIQKKFAEMGIISND